MCVCCVRHVCGVRVGVLCVLCVCVCVFCEWACVVCVCVCVYVNILAVVDRFNKITDDVNRSLRIPVRPMVNRGSTSCQSGVNQGSTSGRPLVDHWPTKGQLGVNAIPYTLTLNPHPKP